MRPLFLFTEGLLYRPGAIRKERLSLDRMVKKLWIEIWTYGMLYRSTWGIM